jgi:predicted metalloprotease with PDZ domain
MRKYIVFFFASVLLAGCGSLRQNSSIADVPVLVTIDLAGVEADRVEVVMDPGSIPGSQLRFFIPKTVPGTYSEDNYGRFVEDLQALDATGKPLRVKRDDINSWTIYGAQQMDKIRYFVNDTFDTESEQEEAVFSPAGSNILKNENYLLNLHGFVGYFEGLKELPYRLEFIVPAEMRPVTSLRELPLENGNFGFSADRYFEVIDNPVQFTSQPSASFQLGDIRVRLSVYSPNETYSAADLKPSMERMMKAQKTFLGEIDGTREYNILLYLSTLNPDDAAGFGALEHHTSTVVVLPEQMSREQLEKTMTDVVSHEFFHIVTPLNVHSEEIQYFDYNNPSMSQHLWMYEGTTEYFANLFQIQQGLISEEEFYVRMAAKIQNASGYNDSLSFTEMSKNVLKDPYAAQYANVYEKGALINMALDLRLRELSRGEMGVLDLMKALSDKYDVDTPFRDDILIDEIVRLTFPEVRPFFEKHVMGGQPIPYEEYFAKAGLGTREVAVESGFFLNGQIPFIDVDPSNTDKIFIRKGIRLNTFFTGLGAEGGDVIKQINGVPITLESVRNIVGESFGWNAETPIEMVVEREGEQITLKGTAGKPTVVENRLSPLPDATEQQIALREAWLRG